MQKCDFNEVAEIALRHGCSPVHLLHIFRTHFRRNTSGWLLLQGIDEWPFPLNKVGASSRTS